MSFRSILYVSFVALLSISIVSSLAIQSGHADVPIAALFEGIVGWVRGLLGGESGDDGNSAPPADAMARTVETWLRSHGAAESSSSGPRFEDPE